MPLEDEHRIGHDLHERWLAEERVAFDEIFVRYTELLVAHLWRYVRTHNLYRTDEDTIRDAVVDALVSYRERPSRYDPAKGKTLAGYLRMAAEGDHKNRLTKQRPPGNLRVVELEDQDWNRVIAEEPAVEDDVSTAVDAEALFERMMELAETDEERIVARLWWLGEERPTATYAAALGIDHLSGDEQAAYVQRIKDRLDQRRRRRFPGGRGDEPAR
jgi:hypothetical protein